MGLSFSPLSSTLLRGPFYRHIFVNNAFSPSSSRCIMISPSSCGLKTSSCAQFRALVGTVDAFTSSWIVEIVDVEVDLYGHRYQYCNDYTSPPIVSLLLPSSWMSLPSSIIVYAIVIPSFDTYIDGVYDISSNLHC